VPLSHCFSGRIRQMLALSRQTASCIWLIYGLGTADGEVAETDNSSGLMDVKQWVVPGTCTVMDDSFHCQLKCPAIRTMKHCFRWTSRLHGCFQLRRYVVRTRHRFLLSRVFFHLSPFLLWSVVGVSDDSNLNDYFRIACLKLDDRFPADEKGVSVDFVRSRLEQLVNNEWYHC